MSATAGCRRSLDPCRSHIILYNIASIEAVYIQTIFIRLNIQLYIINAAHVNNNCIEWALFCMSDNLWYIS